MELRQLQYFVSAAQLGSIRAAALSTGLTQPALSRQIKALEEDLGAALFIRTAHSIQLTSQGEILLQEGAELLRQARQLREKVQQRTAQARWRVGYAPSLSMEMVTQGVAAFQKSHPLHHVELLDLSTTEMNAELATGHLDLAICVRPEKPCPEAQWDILAEIHWTLALPRTHALASKKEILLADIAQLNVLALCPREYPEYWVFVQNWLQRHKVFVGLRAEFDGVVSLLTAVRTGMGVALVAATTAQNFPLWAEYRLLEVEPDPVPLSLAYHRDLAQSQPAQALRQALQDAGRKHLPREGDF